VLFSRLQWQEAAWEGRVQFRRLALSPFYCAEVAPHLLQNSFSLKKPLPKSLLSIKKTKQTQIKILKGTKYTRINFLNYLQISWV